MGLPIGSVFGSSVLTLGLPRVLQKRRGSGLGPPKHPRVGPRVRLGPGPTQPYNPAQPSTTQGNPAQQVQPGTTSAQPGTTRRNLEELLNTASP